MINCTGRTGKLAQTKQKANLRTKSRNSTFMCSIHLSRNTITFHINYYRHFRPNISIDTMRDRLSLPLLALENFLNFPYFRPPLVWHLMCLWLGPFQRWIVARNWLEWGLRYDYRSLQVPSRCLVVFVFAALHAEQRQCVGQPESLIHADWMLWSCALLSLCSVESRSPDFLL